MTSSSLPFVQKSAQAPDDVYQVPLVICPNVYICVSCIHMQACDSVYTAKLLVATPHLLAVPVSGATSDKLLVAVVSPAGACAASVRWKAVGD